MGEGDPAVVTFQVFASLFFDAKLRDMTIQIPLLEEAMKIGEDRQIRVSDTIIRQAAANLNIIMAI